MNGNIDLGKLTPDEIIKKVQSKEIESCTCNTVSEYLMAMESS